MDLLKLYRGEQLLTQVVLAERPLELGRAPGCDIVVDDPEVAERHWLATRRLGTVVAYDVAAPRPARAQHLPLGQRIPLGRDHSLVRVQGELARAGADRDTETLCPRRVAASSVAVVVGRGADARRLRV